VVAKQHGLRALEVRVARQNNITVPFCKMNDDRLKRSEKLVDLCDLIAKEHADVEATVPAPAVCSFPPVGPPSISRFSMFMWIFELHAELERARDDPFRTFRPRMMRLILSS
jgi:hypothetical protein